MPTVREFSHSGCRRLRALAAPQNENELGANTTGGNNAAFSELSLTAADDSQDRRITTPLHGELLV